MTLIYLSHVVLILFKVPLLFCLYNKCAINDICIMWMLGRCLQNEIHNTYNALTQISFYYYYYYSSNAHVHIVYGIWTQCLCRLRIYSQSLSCNYSVFTYTELTVLSLLLLYVSIWTNHMSYCQFSPNLIAINCKLFTLHAAWVWVLI